MSLPREEISAFLPSTTQQRGHTVSLHPDQEGPSVTTAQHRDLTAPFPSDQDAPPAPVTIMPVFLSF